MNLATYIPIVTASLVVGMYGYYWGIRHGRHEIAGAFAVLALAGIFVGALAS